MATTRDKQKAETRRRLLEAAADLFAELGYEGTTTRQIAENCDLSIGTVFAHFPNKQKLLQAVLYDGVEQSLNRARARLDPDADVAEAASVFAASLYRFYVERRELSRELLKHSLFDTSDFADQLLGFREELLTYLGSSADAPANDQDAELVVDALFSHYFFMLLSLLNDERMTPARAVNRLRRMNALVLAGA